MIIRARLPAEQGALIVKVLEMAMDRQFADREVTAVTSEDREPIAARRGDVATNCL